MFRHPNNYPLVNWHRPWQIGVGRLVSMKNWLFSGSMLIYQRVKVRLGIRHAAWVPWACEKKYEGEKKMRGWSIHDTSCLFSAFKHNIGNIHLGHHGSFLGIPTMDFPHGIFLMGFSHVGLAVVEQRKLGDLWMVNGKSITDIVHMNPYSTI